MGAHPTFRDGYGLCDSPLEGDGFELVVPRHGGDPSAREARSNKAFPGLSSRLRVRGQVVDPKNDTANFSEDRPPPVQGETIRSGRVSEFPSKGAVVFRVYEQEGK